MLPKHWWEGTDAAGKKRDVGATTLEPPLGNGAYRIKEFVAGRTIVYERVKDYWGKDLNVNIGRDNFDELRYEYFRDSTVALEAFKGDVLDWRTENSAKNWATAYDFPGRPKDTPRGQENSQTARPGRSRGSCSTPREKFSDSGWRLALNYCVFDFEEMTTAVLRPVPAYRIYFDGPELGVIGSAEGKELEISKPSATRCRGGVPRAL